LTVTLKLKEDEMEQLEEMLRDRDGLIEELEKQIGDRAESVKSVKSTTVKK